MTVTYVADFSKDWMQIMREALKALGITHDPNLVDDQLSLTFWNARLRFVGLVPRTVHLAKEFQCPPASQADLDALTTKFETGDDVNPHFSNERLDTKKANFNDGLFNDWRIQHFHLGKDGKRGGDCLFAIVQSDAAYYIGIYPHGVYGEVELFARVRDNWPHLVGGYQTTIPPTLTPPTAKVIMQARKGGVTTLTQLADGSVWAPPGGGITSAKVGARVVDVSDAAFDRVAYWQQWFDRQAPDGIAKAQAKGVMFGTPPTFKLGIDPGNDFFAYDETAKIRINLGQMMARSFDD